MQIHIHYKYTFLRHFSVISPLTGVPLLPIQALGNGSSVNATTPLSSLNLSTHADLKGNLIGRQGIYPGAARAAFSEKCKYQSRFLCILIQMQPESVALLIHLCRRNKPEVLREGD